MPRKQRHLSNTIGENIVKYRLSKGWTQPQLAVKCGWGVDAQGRISHYEQGRRSPNYADLKVLAEAFGIGVAQLLVGAGADAGIHIVMRELPLIPSPDAMKKRTKQTKLLVPAPHTLSAQAFVLHVRDSSMAPVFHPGDIVVVDPHIDPHLEDYVACNYKGEMLVRQYIAVERRFYFKALRGKTPPIPYEKNVTPIYGVVRSKLTILR